MTQTADIWDFVTKMSMVIFKKFLYGTMLVILAANIPQKYNISS